MLVEDEIKYGASSQYQNISKAFKWVKYRIIDSADSSVIKNKDTPATK